MSNIFKNYRVYIIGNIPSYPSYESRMKFQRAKTFLEKGGFHSITNPFETDLFKEGISLSERKRQNFMKLMQANAVYVLSDVPITGPESTELKIAKDLNMLIIHDHNWQ